MALTAEQRRYVVRAVVRILKDVNRDEILSALKEDVLETVAQEAEEELELDLVVLAVAEACRERLRLRRRGGGEAEEA
jgi:hypothetical protein